MKFSYLGVDTSGKRKKGLIEANNQQEVLDYMRSNNLVPLEIKPAKESVVHSLPFFKKITNNDIVLFTRQLSSMVLTGLTLVESLNVLKQQAANPAMKEVITDLIANISEGETFSKALQNYPHIFSPTYIALIKAAEAGGLLDKVLERLADNLEKSDNIKRQIRGALFYPLIIIVGVLLVIVVMNIFVVPQLGQLYESLGVELPFVTRLVLAFSNYSFTIFPLLILFSGGLFVLYKRLQQNKLSIGVIDKVKLKIPVFGQITTLSILDEVSRTLSLLISSGVSIIEALNITANVAGNLSYKNALLSTAELIEKGIPLSQALDAQNLFPPTIVQMVKVGESSGKIDEGLYKVSEYFERDLNQKIKTLTTSIEPLLIVVLGGIVAFLIFAVISPIYQIISQIQ